jgi:cytoskeletal protein CcmA (bactofilin family)/anti-sigma factor RsiW
MNQSDGHFDEMTALLYLEGQLDAGHAGEVNAHVASCAACRELLHALETEGVWLREALTSDNESIPARVVAAPERGSAHWGWIVAFGLGAGGAYTLWSGIVEPWLAGASQVGLTQGSLLNILLFTGAFWKGWDSMRILMEFLAIATLGTIALWLVRKQWQRFTAIAFVASGLAGALALPQPVAAAEVQRGDPSYTLPAGQEAKTDLLVFAERAQIDGDVDGDLIVFGNTVIVHGHVKGDIIAFSQVLRVDGPVDGNVRSFVQSLALNSTVGKNVMAWSQEMDLDQKARIGGTMMGGVTDLVLNGNVGGDVFAMAHATEINGSMGHDVTINAERGGDRLTIGPSAEIAGQTKYTGTRQPDVSPSAKLGSPPQVSELKRGPDYSQLRYYWHQVMFWGASFLLGLVILLVAPGFFFDVEQACSKLSSAIGFGALFLFATPIAAIIVCATIVGLSVGIPAILLYAVAIYASQIFVGAWLGEKLLGSGVGVGPAIGRLALGLLILRVVRMLPYAGFWIGLLIAMWGLGAVILALHKRMHTAVATA